MDFHYGVPIMGIGGTVTKFPLLMPCYKMVRLVIVLLVSCLFICCSLVWKNSLGAY